MYFYRIRALKRQLIAARLTDSQAVRYLVANSAATALAMALPPGNWSTWDTVFGLAGVALTALGTVWVYRQNGGHRGRHFLSRYMAVSWVVGTRFVTAVLVVLVLVMVAVSLTAPVADAGPIPQTDGWDALLFLGLAGIYFQRVGAHVRDVALAAQPPDPDAAT